MESRAFSWAWGLKVESGKTYRFPGDSAMLHNGAFCADSPLTGVLGTAWLWLLQAWLCLTHGTRGCAHGHPAVGNGLHSFRRVCRQVQHTELIVIFGA